MSPVRIERSFKVSNVIVTPDSVRGLVQIVERAAGELPPQKQYHNQRFTFTATTSDGAHYSSETPELFAKDGELDTKQIERITIALYDSSNDAAIDIELSERYSRLDFGNEIRIRGRNSTWVSGISEQLKGAVGGFKKQDAWPRQYAPLLVLIAAYSFGQAIIQLADWIFDHVIHVTIKSPILEILPGHEWFWRLVGFVWTVIIGAPLTTRLMDYLLELWPPVEFRMGLEWMQELPDRKRRLAWFATAVILPLVLRFVYDALKHYHVL